MVEFMDVQKLVILFGRMVGILEFVFIIVKFVFLYLFYFFISNFLLLLVF